MRPSSRSFRPLPYLESDRLIYSYDSFPGAGVERAGTSVPNYFDRRAMTNVFEEVALYQFAGYRVGEGATAEGVSAIDVTPSFFHVLRTEAATGRLFHLRVQEMERVREHADDVIQLVRDGC